MPLGQLTEYAHSGDVAFGERTLNQIAGEAGLLRGLDLRGTCRAAWNALSGDPFNPLPWSWWRAAAWRVPSLTAAEWWYTVLGDQCVVLARTISPRRGGEASVRLFQSTAEGGTGVPGRSTMHLIHVSAPNGGDASVLVHGSDKPWGGVVLIRCRDLYQTPSSMATRLEMAANAATDAGVATSVTLTHREAKWTVLWEGLDSAGGDASEQGFHLEMKAKLPAGAPQGGNTPYPHGLSDAWRVHALGVAFQEALAPEHTARCAHTVAIGN